MLENVMPNSSRRSSARTGTESSSSELVLWWEEGLDVTRGRLRGLAPVAFDLPVLAVLAVLAVLTVLPVMVLDGSTIISSGMSSSLSTFCLHTFGRYPPLPVFLFKAHSHGASLFSYSCTSGAVTCRHASHLSHCSQF